MRKPVVAATSLLVLTVIASVAWFVVIARYVGADAGIALVPDLLTLLPFVVVGSVLIHRRPRQLTGWLLGGCGLGLVINGLVNAYVDVAFTPAGTGLPVDLRVALIGNPLSIVAASLGLVLLPLLYPDGRPPGPRWRWVVRLALGAIVLVVITAPFAEESIRVYPGEEKLELGPNPFAAWTGAGILRALATVAFAVSLGMAPLALASLVVRYRRADAVVRLQIRWLATACGIFVGALTMLLLSDVVGLDLPETVWDLAMGGSAALIPVSVGIAILRYRLYEIDRLINRTAVYATLTAVLVAVYALSVVVLQTVLSPVVGSSDLAVAGSTLAVAALFGPLRRRTQRLVDRRFNRAHYDAARTVESFGQRLRDEVDIDSLARQLRHVAAESLHPRSVSLLLVASRGDGR